MWSYTVGLKVLLSSVVPRSDFKIEFKIECIYMESKKEKKVLMNLGTGQE